VAGLIELAQYSMPVPSGKAISRRPPDITSSIAYASARRFGISRFAGTPKQQIFARLVCGISAAAMMVHTGIIE
jgi:hypothetical protein